jgi:uncharacterized repeat protein (TIGR02543 family)
MKAMNIAKISLFLLIALTLVSIGGCQDDVLNTYIVTYHGNGNTGGSVPIDSNTYAPGTLATVLGKGDLTKTGYDFIGWNTKADGSGTLRAVDSQFAIENNNVTLYAAWQAKQTYTITYNGNGNTGGSVPVDNTQYEALAQVTVLGVTGTLVKTGYLFDGWNTQADGNGTKREAGDTFTISSANMTLYAQWKSGATYTVTYLGNGNTGGTVPIDASTYFLGDTVTTKLNTGNLVKDGYKPLCWNPKADGSGISVLFGNTFTMGSEDVALYMKWKEATYDISYSLNGGTNHDDNPATYTIVTDTITLQPPTRTGYIFEGWYDNDAFEGTAVTQIPKGTLGNRTFYAKWRLKYLAKTVVVNKTYEDYPNYSDYHSYFAIMEDGSVWGWGTNYHGQLGVDSGTASITTPVKIYNDPNDEAVAVELGGRFFSFLRTESGKLFATGENYYGQQGTGDDHNQRATFTPVKHPNGTNDFENAIAMDAGYTHSCVVDENNIAYTFGDNSYGILGLGNDTPVGSHVLVPTVAEQSVASCALGFWLSAVLCTDGTVKTAGNKIDGQLGRVVNDAEYSADFYPALTNADGNPALDHVTMLSANFHTLLALRDDGTVWGTGDNQFGQLGDDTQSNRTYFVQMKGENGSGTLTGVDHIASGRLYSLMLKGNGELWATGYYYSTATTTHGSKTPVKLMENIKMADINRLMVIAKTDGSVWTGAVDNLDELTQVIFDDPQ